MAKDYVAYATTHIPKPGISGKSGWRAVPYTLDTVKQEYVPDMSGAVTGTSRGEAVEKLHLRNFNYNLFPTSEDGINFRKGLLCLDWTN
jgi:hypothetical protein